MAAGYEEGKTISLDPGKIEKFAMSTGENIRQLFVVPLEDYNRIMGADETLQEDEVLVYQTKSSYKYDEIAFDDGTKWKVKKKLSEFVDNGVDSMQIMPSVLFCKGYGYCKSGVQQMERAAGRIPGENARLLRI